MHAAEIKQCPDVPVLVGDAIVAGVVVKMSVTN
jgi:hypothetical protein